MTEFSERHRLILGDDFSAGMRRAADAAKFLNALATAQQATWEPHDWEDFT